MLMSKRIFSVTYILFWKKNVSIRGRWYLFIYLFTYLFIYLFIYLLIYLFICYLFIHYRWYSFFFFLWYIKNYTHLSTCYSRYSLSIYLILVFLKFFTNVIVYCLLNSSMFWKFDWQTWAKYLCAKLFWKDCALVFIPFLFK